MDASVHDVERATATPADTARGLVVRSIGGGGVAPSAPTVTPTLSNVADAATAQQLLGSNASRKGVILWNDSTVRAVVKYGANAGLTDGTIPMGPGAYWEMPVALGIYIGVLSAIWESDGTGAMRVTELA